MKTKKGGRNIINTTKINATKSKEKIKLEDLAMPFMCYDLVMKAIFTDDVNILAKMVADITGIDYKVLENNTILETNEIPINNLNEKAKRCDFVLRINKDRIINLELNSSYYPGLIIKNLSYPFGIFSNATKKSEEYNENLITTQLNLNCYDKNNDEDLEQYQLQEVNSHKLYTKNITIFNLNVVKCLELYYNLDNLNDVPKHIKWGALIYNRDLNKIPKIVDGIMTIEERNRLMSKIDKLTKDDKFMSELEAIKMLEWEERSKMTYAKNLGIAEGEAKGRIEGKEENTKELILSMLDNKLSLDMISKITNKSIDEIKKIIN